MGSVDAEGQAVIVRLVDELKHALMECSICLVSSDANGRPLPLKILPCHHTVCADCLCQLWDAGRTAVIRCPECRRPVSVPDSGVEGLQDNFITARIQDITGKYLAEAQESASSSTMSTCGLCGIRIRKAAHGCMSCGFLCDSCTWRHRDDKKSLHGRHQVFPTNDEDVRASDGSSHFCSRHNFCHLDYLCETCQGRPICKLCRQLDHGEHTVREARLVAQEALAQTEKLLESALNRQSQVFDVFKKVRQAEAKAQRQMDEHKKELIHFVRECGQVLKCRELELLGSLEHRHGQLTESLNHAKERARNLLARIGSSLELAERLRRQPDPVVVVREARSIGQPLRDLLDAPLDADVADYDESLLAVDTGDLRFDVAAFKYLVSLLGKTTADDDGTSDTTSN